MIKLIPVMQLPIFSATHSTIAKSLLHTIVLFRKLIAELYTCHH